MQNQNNFFFYHRTISIKMCATFVKQLQILKNIIKELFILDSSTYALYVSSDVIKQIRKV